MASDFIHVAYDGPVATITIDDGRGNAVNFDYLDQFDRAIREAERAHVVIIQGREKLLSGGLDLPYLLPLERRRIEQFFEQFDEVHARLLAFPRPIITVARGSAIAGGAVLLCAGDVRLATEAGRVGINETVLGFSFPTTAIELVRVALGDQRLAEVATAGKIYEGAERVRVGFVTEVVPADQLAARTQAIAAEFAAADPDAVAIVREQIRRPVLARVREYAAVDRKVFVDRWFSPGTQARLKALVDRLSKR